MRFFDLDRWHEVWVTITRNKTRSILTCFGIFWGIFMLVTLLGASNGLSGGIMRQIEGFATNTAAIWTDRTSEPYKGYQKDRRWTMNSADLEIIRRNVPSVRYLTPLGGMRGQNNISYKDNVLTQSVNGYNPDLFKIMAMKVYYGRLLTEIDVAEYRKVCLLGVHVYEELFRKGTNPVGEYVKISGIYFQIVGVVDQVAQGVNINGRVGDMVIIPYSTMQRAFNLGDDISNILFTSSRIDNIAQAREEVTELLKRNHDIAPTDNKAVGGFDSGEQMRMFNSLFLAINILVWIVGLGTLFSGIVGVSNIMVVTVRERTREIGVRRALGAAPMNIVSQILSESVVLTLMAGFIGLSFGVFVLDIIGRLVDFENETMAFIAPEINFKTAITASVVVFFSGVIASLLPIWRAMQIKAIDAIRDE